MAVKRELGNEQTTYELLLVGRIQGCDPPNAGDRPITFGGTRPWFRPTGLRGNASGDAPASEVSNRRSGKGCIPTQSVTAIKVNIRLTR